MYCLHVVLFSLSCIWFAYESPGGDMVRIIVLSLSIYVLMYMYEFSSCFIYIHICIYNKMKIL